MLADRKCRQFEGAVDRPSVRMSPKRLIVNADGFGFGPGATQGIFDALAGGGPITSVSVNANFPDVARVTELLARHPEVSVGVHLNPIVGSPCLPPADVPTLVGGNGEFHGRRSGDVAKQGDFGARAGKRVRRTDPPSSRACGRARHTSRLAGTFPSSLSQRFLSSGRKERAFPVSRTNASLIGLEDRHPAMARFRAYLRRPDVCLGHAFRRMQMRRAVRLGFRLADRVVTVGYAGTGNKTVLENWVNVFRNLPDGTFEIFCHPGYPDAVLRRWSTRYAEPRLAELAILRSPMLREVAREEDVALISFHDLLVA